MDGSSSKRQKVGETEDPSVSGYKSAGRSSKQSGNTLEEKLSQFWSEMMEDVQEGGTDLTEFKTQQLPLARIKKIMKSDEDVRMISAEAPVLFAKACEFFILEMTLRAWHVAEEQKRKTLTRQDISTAVNRTEVWDFLADTVPGEEGAQMPPAMGGQRPMGVQMDSYQPQYMAMPGGGAPPGGMFAGMQPMPMMYQGIPPHMFMQNPQQQQQQQDGDSGNGNTTATNGEGQEEGS
ncbi:Nuclear transcription factor Y subunit C-4 [Picochlorum sp. SENEW3]|nr:Nuclear transcription factor Y subunit C-4 [Picochlorum sp. SENEW3]